MCRAVIDSGCWASSPADGGRTARGDAAVVWHPSALPAGPAGSLDAAAHTAARDLFERLQRLLPPATG